MPLLDGSQLFFCWQAGQVHCPQEQFGEAERRFRMRGGCAATSGVPKIPASEQTDNPMNAVDFKVYFIFCLASRMVSRHFNPLK